MKKWRLLLIPGALFCALFLVNLVLVYARSPFPDTPDQPQSTLEVQVNYADDWVAGNTDAWAAVEVYVMDSLNVLRDVAVVTASAAGDYFVACDDWFSGWCPDIQPGDRVGVYATGFDDYMWVDPVGSITGKLDGINNTVQGILVAEGFTGTLNVACAVWADPGPSPIFTTAVANGGSFSCDFDDVGWDLERGDIVAVSYYEPDLDQVINILDWPWTRVNYEHDWVGVNYDLGHTFWITVTDSLGGLKATGSSESISRGGWGGPGFDDGDWSPQRPDIVPGDFIYVLSDDGYTNTLNVGQITGNLSVAADSITGPIFAPDFNVASIPTLPVECHPWGAWDAGLGWILIRTSSAAPDGSSPYSCDWAGEWDILPGQDIGVMYIEPDEDRVIDIFRQPAPYLTLDMQTQGEPGVGGNYLFQITYQNQGDAPAYDVNIVLTEATGMNYLSDTTGIAPEVLGGGQLKWGLGMLEPGASISFDMFFAVTAASGQPVSNQLQITTSSFDQGEAWEKEATWQGVVAENDTYLAVEKMAYTPDPAPGEALIFEVTICNLGGTGSSLLTMTDILGPGMVIDTWWAQQAGWNEVSQLPNQLVASTPTIPGFDCRAVNLRALVDEGLPLATPLPNTASIAASNDLDADNNLATWEGQTAEPHTNLRIEKGWNGGQLTPGGDIHYGIAYENTGNIPVGSFRITDTLPANTQFISAWHEDPSGGFLFAPIFTTTNSIVWEIDVLENGMRGEFDVYIKVDSDASVDQALVNTVEVTPLPEEDTYDDNQAAWTEILRDPGPNLRVKKWHNWEEDGHLSYQVSFENIGDETVSDILIIDTLPLDTAYNTFWDLQFDEERFTGMFTTTQEVIWAFSEIYPGEMGWFNFSTLLDEPGAPVRWYTNTIQIDGLQTDINPVDNAYTDVAFSGGEIDRVGFWLDELHGGIWGQAITGSVITVTIMPTRTLLAYADPVCEGCWEIPDAGPVLPGDEIIVEAGEGLLPVMMTIPEPFTAQADSTADSVSGEIGGWLSRPVSIYAEWLDDVLVVDSDAGGGFEGAFTDLPPAGRGYVQITDMVNYAEVIIQKPFRALDLLLSVNYAHDWVEGLYEPEHTVWITVTESSGGTVKGQAELQSYPIPAWGGETGFSTIYDGWDGDHPDLQPGDWIFGEVDNGFEGALPIGDLSIEVGLDTDEVFGNLSANWLSSVVLLRCEIWSHPEAPGVEVWVDPDGGSYNCNFAQKGWDLQPDQMIAVMYFTPEGHRVINIWEIVFDFQTFLPIIRK